MLTPDPLGQYAHYKVINGERTTSLIRSGHTTVTVAEYMPDHDQGPSYKLVADYEAKVTLYGTYAGTEEVDLPTEYFTEEFLDELRQTGEYQTEDFKVRHLGYRDARLFDGSFYEQCDYLVFYDIDTTKDNLGLQFFIRAALGQFQDGIVLTDVEDLKIYAKVKPGIPVLGGVQLDVSGKMSGLSAKAGFDYVKP